MIRNNNGRLAPEISRRRLLQGVGALLIASRLPAARAGPELPPIPSLTSFLAGRSPRWERLHLELPPLADNGQAVPMRLSLPGPFASDSTLQAIHLFSEKNPVPEMAVFEFPSPPAKVEVESRVRLAGAQHLVAVAVMSDGVLYADAAEVLVTIAGCLDAS
jgi:sulfur-oxidizing protein SoxY